MSSETNKLINGPINIVRLEGHINGVKKVGYFFMDYHINIYQQTKCPSFTSQDIVQFLATNLNKATFPIDFMFEMQQSWIDSKRQIIHKDIYIREVLNFFNSQYNSKNGKVRYHFIDIRDYINDTTYLYFNNIKNIVHHMNQNNNYNVDDVNDLKFYLSNLTQELNYWKDVIFGNFDEIKSKTEKNLKRLNKDKEIDNTNVKQEIKEVPKFIYKIREKFKNKEIRNNLQDIFDFIKNSFDRIQEISSEMIQVLEKNSNAYIQSGVLRYDKFYKSYFWDNPTTTYVAPIKDITILLDKMDYVILTMFAMLTDIYFLRRFLDKDYIQHAIIYTGCSHSINYIQHLMTKYDFNITHVSYSLKTDLEELNKHLKKFTDTNDQREFEKNLYPPNLVQCSVFEHFPKNFE